MRFSKLILFASFSLTTGWGSPLPVQPVDPNTRKPLPIDYQEDTVPPQFRYTTSALIRSQAPANAKRASVIKGWHIDLSTDINEHLSLRYFGVAERITNGHVQFVDCTLDRRISRTRPQYKVPKIIWRQLPSNGHDDQDDIERQLLALHKNLDAVLYHKNKMVPFIQVDRYWRHPTRVTPETLDFVRYIYLYQRPQPSHRFNIEQQHGLFRELTVTFSSDVLLEDKWEMEKQVRTFYANHRSDFARNSESSHEGYGVNSALVSGRWQNIAKLDSKNELHILWQQISVDFVQMPAYRPDAPAMHRTSQQSLPHANHSHIYRYYVRKNGGQGEDTARMTKSNLFLDTWMKP